MLRRVDTCTERDRETENEMHHGERERGGGFVREHAWVARSQKRGLKQANLNAAPREWLAWACACLSSVDEARLWRWRVRASEVPQVGRWHGLGTRFGGPLEPWSDWQRLSATAIVPTAHWKGRLKPPGGKGGEGGAADAGGRSGPSALVSIVIHYKQMMPALVYGVGSRNSGTSTT